MTSLKTRLVAVARNGLFLALVALGITLVVSEWANRGEVERISALLDRAQAERFFQPVPPLHDRHHGPATSAELSQLLAQFRGEGLRYLVEYDADGAVVSEAGQHVGIERPRPGENFGPPRVVADRVRVTFRPPSRREGKPDLVVEFEPTISTQLRQHADRRFAFSIAVAVSLLALTFGLWLAVRREELRRAQSERERQLTALGEMSAVLAHEIRNPLASLKGHAQLLGEQLGTESLLHKKVDRIVGEAKRLEELTSTLLDFVRASSVSRAATDPARLVREAAAAVDSSVVVDSERAPPNWQLDPLRMEQVLKNLLQNAVQASAEPGSVEASVRVEGGELVIAVRDHGPGLGAGSEQRVFEAFHTTRVQGTGLGLAVARRIVELHGGRIRGENHPDGGAVFTLLIPA
jgi:two-component system, NtrC family, sensor histidine kinase HydH